MMSKEIVIKFNRKKTITFLFFSAVLAIISFLFVLNPEKYKSFLFFRREVIFLIGIAGLIFFGISSIYIAYKLISNRAGLIINDTGIYDNTTMNSVGWISWEDIASIEICKIPHNHSVSILLIKVKEPKKYINRFSAFKRKILNLTNKNYGTPIAINTNGLSYNPIELANLLTKKRNEFIQKSR